MFCTNSPHRPPNHYSTRPSVHANRHDAPSTLVITVARPIVDLDVDGVAFIDLSLLAPLSPLRDFLPSSAERILVLE